MRVFHELTNEEIAMLHHQRTLAVLAELRDYRCTVVLSVAGPDFSVLYLEVLDVGHITTSTETYHVYDTKDLLQGYYQSAARAVRKLMVKEDSRWISAQQWSVVET